MTVQELDSLLGLLTSRPKPLDPTPQLLRERFDKLADFLPSPEDLIYEPVDAGGVPGAFISAPGADASRCVYYLHGGGYVIGSVATHRILAYDLSKASGVRVLSMEYRLAPEHPFPAGLEDAIDGYKWLLQSGIAPEHVLIAGDSAGGGLAVATLLALRDRGISLPAAAVCFSPWVDLEGAGESMSSRAEVDPMVQKAALLWYTGLYMAGGDPRDPLASPLHGELSGLPSMLIQVGDCETLLDDSTRLAERLRAAGVPVELEVWDRMIHVWQIFAPILSEGRDAIDKAGAFIAGKLR
ncbi:MAG: alpha/beta hydrolase [Proteobacteria bacterium]|nr:alpha/beta hydrolase [Pseudomonadota bacterium]MDA1308948.1 alpha/beta hydrolase [Pseudomonadota bacterium]